MTTSTTMEGIRRRCYQCRWAQADLCDALVALRRLKSTPLDMRAVQIAQREFAHCIKDRLSDNLTGLRMDEWRP